MKRFLSLLLALALLLPAAALASEQFGYTDAADARRQALEAFRVCAFSAEYHNNGRDSIVRWEEPIRVFAAGKPGATDLRRLDEFLTQLSLRVPGLPVISRVDAQSQANVVIHYCRLSEMPSLIPSYVSGNWGYFSFQSSGGRIISSTIGIAYDVCDQQARNHLMMEELTGCLGLANDHNLYRDSILYQPWTTVQSLSEVDWIMLNYLYSPLVSPGDTWNTVERAIRERYGL